MAGELHADGRTEVEHQWRLSVQVELSRAGLASEHDAWRDCQHPDTTRSYVVCPTDPAHYAKAVRNTCHLRVCPDCARRHSARLIARYLAPMDVICSTGNRAYRARHIVLTTAVSLRDPAVAEKLADAYRAVGRLFDRLLGRGWQSRGMGYLVAAEFGESGHRLHFHIVFYGKWIDKPALTREWEALTGFCVTYVRGISSCGFTLRQALGEVLKYATKLSQVAPELVPVLLVALKGRRRIRSRGVFYNMSPVEPPEPTCPECGCPLAVWTDFRYRVWAYVQPEVPPVPDFYEQSGLDWTGGNKPTGPPDLAPPVRRLAGLDALWGPLEGDAVEDLL